MIAKLETAMLPTAYERLHELLKQTEPEPATEPTNDTPAADTEAAPNEEETES